MLKTPLGLSSMAAISLSLKRGGELKHFVNDSKSSVIAYYCQLLSMKFG